MLRGEFQAAGAEQWESAEASYEKASHGGGVAKMASQEQMSESRRGLSAAVSVVWAGRFAEHWAESCP